VICDKKDQVFEHFKILSCHKLPLTNCIFNKAGDKFLTGSYDHTCMIWDTETGQMLQKLQGHKSVVYALAFNLPYGNKVATGSFDTNAKVIININIINIILYICYSVMGCK
jgi:dynein assembly factor with WDR repeat domains 1